MVELVVFTQSNTTKAYRLLFDSLLLHILFKTVFHAPKVVGASRFFAGRMVVENKIL